MLVVTDLHYRHPITFSPIVDNLNSMENPVVYRDFKNKKAMVTASFYVTYRFYSIGKKEYAWEYYSNDYLKIRFYTESQLTTAGWLEVRK
jgi:hypothetical protein